VKKQTTLRDNIYQMMDTLIHHAITTEKPLAAITLTNDQFQIFADFNKPGMSGEYYYRHYLVRSK